MPDLLIELFSEEIPARMQGRAAEDLRKLVTDGLVEAGLTYASAAAFATPRRLALTVEGLLAVVGVGGSAGDPLAGFAPGHRISLKEDRRLREAAIRAPTVAGVHGLSRPLGDA